jgi:peptidoglycan/xylan/chitin deacetylase (PgdA/CDA1 family)
MNNKPRAPRLTSGAHQQGKDSFGKMLKDKELAAPKSSPALGTNSKSVPVLITWDVDPDLWISLDKRQRALQTVAELCQGLSLRTTFFFTAKSAHVHLDAMESLQAQGHEIGCHGLTHGNEENYDRMPEDMQRAYIKQATEKLQTLVGAPIRAFRSPRVKTSATTLKLLAEFGYLTDSSVCSQRADLVSSNLINKGWLFSPRRPYRPHQDSAFKRGDVPIWEVPISAMVLPFISSALKVLGPRAMKMLFRILYAESRRTGKPIVYLAHPTEFAGVGLPTKKKALRERLTYYMRREHFSPDFIRAHGFRIRNLLYNVDADTLLDSTQQLFSYMSSFSGVTFMTVSEYAAHLDALLRSPINQGEIV